MQMNLLFLIEALTAGGAERQLVNLMNGLSQKGHKIHLVTWVNQHHFAAEDIPDVKWIQVKRNGKFDLSLFRVIRQTIQQNNIKVVQGFLDTGNLYAWICTRLIKNVQVFASERSSKRNLKGLSKFHKPWVHKWVTTTIANSEVGRKFIYEIAGLSTPVEIIRNGFDHNRFKPASETEKLNLRTKYDVDNNSLVYINVARIIPLKRQLEIVKAFEEIFKNENAFLILIGQANKDYLAELNAFIERKGLNNKVKILAPSNNIHEFYQLSDVFILNSDFEGSPNTLVEAMLCGLTVLSTRCGDASYYIENTSGNELIPTGDYQALKKGILNLSVYSSHERMNIGLQNQIHLTSNLEVSIESLANKYEKLYKSYE